MYPSDILPPLITRSAPLIVNTDPHTSKGTHWLAVRLQPRSHSGYFFDFLSRLNPDILTFFRRACSVWEYNTTQLQGWTNTVCGEYFCLFALYMVRGYTPKQIVGLFDAATAYWQISCLFVLDFGPLHTTRRESQVCTACIKCNYPSSISPFGSCLSFVTH